MGDGGEGKKEGRKDAQKVARKGPENRCKLFCTKFFKNPAGHEGPCLCFPAAPVVGRNLLTSGHVGQECPPEIRTQKFMFMLFFFPEQNLIQNVIYSNLSWRLSEGAG